ncbi:sigma-70 family RNA polymerase sigma factor [Maribellus comscasis]|uniref:Sigma-70 family RNA polymerase sigma factor n=1 Tax=Maribellus comscasis TaxID=2681766 RepID=A0A6I6K260_9BACT|nr:sigma-70 family RNA polymerase sigma factor [Maribellus comscasis]QGY45593.1 sigma-70 family RNA polymerase sigma factor [Maribellus comscasis]
MVARDFKTRVLPVSKKLLRFATHFLKDEDEARDVVQDVFLKLWQKRDTLGEIENIEAFAMRMTRNRCLDVIRANKVVPIDAETDRKLKEESVDVHKQVELSETAAQIQKLINTLPDLQRTVMQLRDIEQMSYEEIAEATDLKINAIRVNLSRARKKVRDEFLKINSNGRPTAGVKTEEFRVNAGTVLQRVNGIQKN